MAHTVVSGSRVQVRPIRRRTPRSVGASLVAADWERPGTIGSRGRGHWSSASTCSHLTIVCLCEDASRDIIRGGRNSGSCSADRGHVGCDRMSCAIGVDCDPFGKSIGCPGLDIWHGRCRRCQEGNRSEGHCSQHFQLFQRQCSGGRNVVGMIYYNTRRSKGDRSVDIHHQH